MKSEVKTDSGIPRREFIQRVAVARKSFEAGASGIVVSREYEEMHVANLKAVGRAVRDLAKT